MNNDWRTPDMSYGYRAGRASYGASDQVRSTDEQQGTYGYGPYSAQRAYAAQDTSYGGRHAADAGMYASAGGGGQTRTDRTYAGRYEPQKQNMFAQGSYGYMGAHSYETDRAYSRNSYEGRNDDYRGYQAGQGYRPRHSYQSAARDVYGQSVYQQPTYGSRTYAGNAQGGMGAYVQGDYRSAAQNYDVRDTMSRMYRPVQEPYEQASRGTYEQTQTQAYQEPSFISGSSYGVQADNASYGYASYTREQAEMQKHAQSTQSADIQQEQTRDAEQPQSNDRRESRPVKPRNEKTQLTVQNRRPASRPLKAEEQEPLSDDMQSRLERMRRAGEAALRAQGYQQEDASTFMNTGMINLDAVIGSMEEENGVDPVLSAQQTARMAVIRQAQMDATLQQPENPGQRAQNSRPGYSARKEDGTHEQQRKKSIWRNVIEWVVLLAVAVGMAFLLRAYIVSFYLVQGSSMEPTFYTGQRLLVNKIGYRLGDIERYDTVVCRYPNSDNYYVKRVIGLPGDTIHITNGQVFVNGESLAEEYVTYRDENDIEQIVVPEGFYMVFGDNRVDSLDSRSIGAIEEDAIVGRVIAVTWPIGDFAAVKRIEDNVTSASQYVPDVQEDAITDEDADENAGNDIGTTDIDLPNNDEAAVGEDIPEDESALPM